MFASIIICTSNRAAHLRETLQAMQTVEVPTGGCELIIVDNASMDGTEEVVSTYCLPNVVLRYVSEPKRGQCYARNTGIASAKGEVILFTDDDVHPTKDWLKRMCAPILNNEADAVIGSVHIAPDLERTWMEDQHKIMLASTDATKPDDFYYLVGANMAFSKNVLARVPAFDTELGPGALGFSDETLFTEQLREAGYRFAVASDAHVVHHFDPARLTRDSFLDRMIKQGRSNAYCDYHWKHQNKSWISVRILRSWLKLLYGRITKQSSRHGLEGMPLWEMGLLSELHYYKQMLKERQRPRNYEKRGLVKLDHSKITL